MIDRKAHGSGKGNGRPEDEGEGLEARLRRLEADLAKRKRRDDRNEAGGTHRQQAMLADALRLSSEFIGAVAVGFGLGYGFDYLLGTTPWGMIVFLLLGFCAGVLNVMRSAGLVAKPRVWDVGPNDSDGNDRSRDG